jgi:hypothetical protein
MLTEILCVNNYKGLSHEIFEESFLAGSGTDFYFSEASLILFIVFAADNEKSKWVNNVKFVCL